jgi:uncharacterized membrane protein YqjE
VSAELGPGLRRLGSAIIGLFATRLELATAELEAERGFIAQSVALAAFIALAMLFVLALLTTLLVAFFWDSHRYAAIGFVTLGWALLAALAGLRLQYLLAHRPPLLSATIQELRADRDALLGEPREPR